VGEVCQLFSAGRWVDQWESIGGYVLIGEGRWGAGGERVPGMAEMVPQLDRRPRDERERIIALRRQVSRPDARMQVIEYLARRSTTRGC
jgi:hypothetical protein